MKKKEKEIETSNSLNNRNIDIGLIICKILMGNLYVSKGLKGGGLSIFNCRVLERISFQDERSLLSVRKMILFKFLITLIGV